MISYCTTLLLTFWFHVYLYTCSTISELTACSHALLYMALAPHPLDIWTYTSTIIMCVCNSEKNWHLFNIISWYGLNQCDIMWPLYSYVFVCVFVDVAVSLLQKDLFQLLGFSTFYFSVLSSMFLFWPSFMHSCVLCLLFSLNFFYLLFLLLLLFS